MSMKAIKCWVARAANGDVLNVVFRQPKYGTKFTKGCLVVDLPRDAVSFHCSNANFPEARAKEGFSVMKLQPYRRSRKAARE